MLWLIALAVLFVLAAFRVLTIIRRAFAPHFEEQPGYVDPTRLDEMSEEQRRRAGYGCLQDALFCLTSSQGDLAEARTGMWKMALGFGLEATERHLVDATEDALLARHALELAADYWPETAVDVDGFDPDVTSPSERLRRRSPILWIGLMLCPRAIRGALDWWLGMARVTAAHDEVVGLRTRVQTLLREGPYRVRRRRHVADRAA